MIFKINTTTKTSIVFQELVSFLSYTKHLPRKVFVKVISLFHFTSDENNGYFLKLRKDNKILENATLLL